MGDYSSRTPVKLSSVVNAQRYVPSTTNTSLIVGVRVRPVLKTEQTKAGRKDIIRVIDGKVVVVLDPDESKDYLDQVQHRTKERRYTFDVAFDFNSTNAEVYDSTLRDLVSAVLYGINTTVFAYGATGSGKTYTMVGTPEDPGLMILSLKQVFQDRDRLFVDEEFSVTCTYLEVYNETIYDLLVKNSGPLELREDPEQGVQVAGLKHVPVSTPDDILGLLEDGNKRRKTEATDANMQSSRSHAVLEICVKRKPANHYRAQQLRAKLSLVDLAGSERAAETNNAGQKLRDGASINRSLLALANCINALGKMASAPHRAGATYVPYRNSKLTRLLKDGLSGNSRTAMITTVAAANDQYHHSINTLKYADRAKEIKTHVVQNVGTVESHIADYQRMIDALQVEVSDLRNQLLERQATPAPALPTPNGNGSSNGRVTSEDDFLVRIDNLVQDMSENIEERINLQKAVFEIEDANLFNRYELKQLEEFLSSGHGGVKDIAEARDRKSDIQVAVKDNERELAKYKAEIQSNEAVRTEIQGKIDRLVSHNNNNAAFLNFMRTFRLQAIRLQELKFQMAVRDQIIHEQRAVIGNLWKIINRSGMGQARVLEIARQEGIIMDGLGTWPMDERPNTAQSDTASYISVINGDEAEAEGQALSGLIAANDQHSATPAATLVGNRAKMRYRFWSHYPPEKGDPDAVEFGRLQGGRRGGLGATARRKALANRMGAGIRVEQILHPHHHHIAVAGRRAGRNTAGDAPSGTSNSSTGNVRSSAAGARSSLTGALNRRLTDEGSGSGRERDGSGRRITDSDNAANGSISRIHSGRRAGLPVPRPSMRNRVPEPQVSFQASSATPTPAIPALRPPGQAGRRHYRSSSHIDFTNEPQSEPVAIKSTRPSYGGMLRDAQPQPPAKPSMQAWSDEPQPDVTPRPPAKMPLSERLARLKGRVANNNYSNSPGYASKLDHDQQSHASPDPKSHPIMTSQFNAQAEETPPGTSSSAPDALDHHARLQQVLQMNRRLSSAEQARRGA